MFNVDIHFGEIAACRHIGVSHDCLCTFLLSLLTPTYFWTNCVILLVFVNLYIPDVHIPTLRRPEYESPMHCVHSNWDPHSIRFRELFILAMVLCTKTHYGAFPISLRGAAISRLTSKGLHLHLHIN